MSSGRCIESGISVFTAAEVRVAVIPIGSVPPEVWGSTLDALSSFRHVSLSASRSFYQEGVGAGGDKSPLQHMDWASAYMHFRFLQGEECKRRSRTFELYPQRLILVVIGVVYCPLWDSMEEAVREFEKACKQFPECMVRRCFAFDPSEAHILQGGGYGGGGAGNPMEQLVMFPPGGRKHLEQHLELWMHDLAARVLTEFERMVLNAAQQTIKLSTFADSGEFTGQSVIDEVAKRLALGDEEVREKRRWGRLMKIKGDYCLMAGSPQDASEYYRTCVEICRGIDGLWCGVALEGIAHARILTALSAAAAFELSQAAGSSLSSSAPSQQRLKSQLDAPRSASAGFGHRVMWELLQRTHIESSVRELLSEARVYFKKRGGVPVLQVESHLKYARLMCGLHGAAARREVSEAVAAALEFVPLLHSLQDRAVASVECAQVLGMVGHTRKRALLLWHAVDLMRGEAGSGSDKGEVLRLAVKGMEPPDDPQSQDPDDGRIRPHWSEHYSHQLQHQGADSDGVTLGAGRSSSWSRLSGPWDSIQLACLESVLSAARGAQAPLEGWESAARLLREHHPTISAQTQIKLMESLAAAAAVLPPRQRARPGQGPGPLVILRRLLPAAPPLQPARLAVASATPGTPGLRRTNTVSKGSAPVFIFNPYAAKRQEAVREAEAGCVEWACADECRVELYLVNPLSVPLRVDGIQLHVVHSGSIPVVNFGSDCRSSSSRSSSSRRSSSLSLATPHRRSSQDGLASSSGSLDLPSCLDVQSTSLPPAGALKLPPMPPSAAVGALPSSGSSFSLPQQQQQQKLLITAPTPHGAAAAAHLGSPVSTRSPTNKSNSTSSPLAVPNSAPAANVTSPLLSSTNSVSGGNIAWKSLPVGLMLPPGPRPTRLVLCGKPLVPGSFTVVGCSVSMWGMSWIQPFCAPSKSGLGMLGRGRALGPAGRVQPPVEIEVLPELPLMQAVLHTGHEFSVTVPCEADIHAPVGQSPGGDPMGRPAPLEVLEGQECRMLLALNNIGGLPIAGITLAVVSQKGVLLKPLVSAGSGSRRDCSAFLLPASFVGAHLEVDDTSLASLLPLQPNGSAVLPVRLLVGRAPRNNSLEDFTLEIRLTYAGVPPAPSTPTSTSPADADPTSTPTATAMGRRMSLALPLRIKPSLAIQGLRFLEAAAPLVNHARLPGRSSLAHSLSSLQMSASPSAASANRTSSNTLQQLGPFLSSYRLQSTTSETSSMAGPLSPIRASVYDPTAAVAAATAAESTRQDGSCRVEPAAGVGEDSSARGGVAGGAGLASLLLSRQTSVKHSASEPVLFLPNGSSNVAGLDLSMSAAQQQQRRSIGTGLPLGSGLWTASTPPTTHPSPAFLPQTASSMSESPHSPASDPHAAASGSPPPLRHASLPNQNSDIHPSSSLPQPVRHGSSSWPHKDIQDLSQGGSSSLPNGSRFAVGGAGGVDGTRLACGAADGLGSCAAGALLSCVSDCVMEVAVGNASDRYFRVWLVEFGEEEAEFERNIRTSRPQVPAPTRGEVLQPSDTTRLLHVSHADTPSTSLPSDNHHHHSSTTSSPDSSHPHPHPNTNPFSSTPALAHQNSLIQTGGRSRGRPPPLQQPSDPDLSSGSSPKIRSADQAHYQHPDHRPPQPTALSQHAAPTTPAAVQTPGSVQSRSFRRRSAGVSGCGGDAGLGDEEGRMTCAEFVAHRWGVRWQMIVADGNGGSVNGNLGGSNSGGGGGSSRGGSIAQPSLFASAGGLEKGGHWPAPEGVVRLSTVDIARALTPSATAVLQPSTLHVHFAAVASGTAGCGRSQLTDLGLHMDVRGLTRGPMLGSIWGLHMQTGDSLDLDMLMLHHGSNPHHLRLSLCITPFAQPATAAIAATLGSSRQASDFAPTRTSPNRNSNLGSSLSGTPSGAFSATTAAVGSSTAQQQGTGTGLARRPETASGMLECVDCNIDAGVLVCGVYEGLELCLQPGSCVSQRFGLSFVCPGWYQVSVGEVLVLDEGANVVAATVGGAGMGSGAVKQGPQKANVSVDKLYIWVE